MPKNLEIKARIFDVERAFSAARKLRAAEYGVLHQTDTYFRVAAGRLKLREIRNDYSELIQYFRNEKSVQRLSEFELFPVEDSARLKRLLTSALGLKGVVEKKRTLFMYHHTRIHIDEVTGLGNFLELETLLGETEEEAEQELSYVSDAFGIQENEYLFQSYIDLLSPSE